MPDHLSAIDRLPSIEELWKEAGFTPNENQEKAIRHTDGPLFLPAGPGSGKTRVLLWRVSIVSPKTLIGMVEM